MLVRPDGWCRILYLGAARRLVKSSPRGWSEWNPPYSELVECGRFWDQYIYSFYWSVMAVAERRAAL